MKQPKYARVIAGAMVALLVFGVVAMALAYILA